jgi:N-acetylglucosaminyldiphosphoundecaprenol N-acetyl-beta-D-mannosaminyltransferase
MFVGRSAIQMAAIQQILGVRFFVGSVSEIVEKISRTGGVVVVPAAPAMVRLRYQNEQYRRALADADFAIADSGLMVLLWKILKRENVTRISGLAYLKHLIKEPSFREPGKTVFVLPREAAKEKTLAWSANENLEIAVEDCYVAPQYGPTVEDGQLLAVIDNRRPAHIIIGIGNGPQEKLGHFLRERLSYRPAIHCVGAALGFLTGDQAPIPGWADRFYLGWFSRLLAQPRIFIPRLARGLELPWLIWKYGENLPPLLAVKAAGSKQKTASLEKDSGD